MCFLESIVNRNDVIVTPVNPIVTGAVYSGVVRTFTATGGLAVFNTDTVGIGTIAPIVVFIKYNPRF